MTTGNWHSIAYWPPVYLVMLLRVSPLPRWKKSRNCTTLELTCSRRLSAIQILRRSSWSEVLDIVRRVDLGFRPTPSERPRGPRITSNPLPFYFSIRRGNRNTACWLVLSRQTSNYSTSVSLKRVILLEDVVELNPFRPLQAYSRACSNVAHATSIRSSLG